MNVSACEMGSGFDIDGYFNSGRVVASSFNLTENYPPTIQYRSMVRFSKQASIPKPDPIFSFFIVTAYFCPVLNGKQKGGSYERKTREHP